MTARQTLTEKGVAALKAPAKGRRLELRDAIVPGLVLRVTDKGVKSWSAVRRINGRLARRTLGTYPIIGLADAREAARTALKLMAEGVDPRERERDQRAREAEQRAEAERRKTGTFAHVVAEYERRHLDKLRPASKRVAMTWINNDLLPAWADMQVDAIERKDVFRVIDAIEDRGAPAARNRCLATIRTFFGWAIERGHVTVDPTARIKLAKEDRRKRVLTDDEIRALWPVWEADTGPWGALFRLLLLTGQRRAEWAKAQRTEIEADVLTVPAARHKAHRDHAVPLVDEAKAIIAARPIHAGSAWLFTINGKVPVTGFSKAKARLDERAGVSGYRLHDLRRTCATGMARAGIPRAQIALVLGHADPEAPAVTATYDVLDRLEEKRAALKAWAALLTRILHPASNVVQLPKPG